MDRISALLTAARRFCIERRAFWTKVYSELQKTEGFKVIDYFRPGWDYSEKAYSIFPRYRLAESTLNNLERLSFEMTTPPQEVVGELIKAGHQAYDELFNEFHDRSIPLAALRLQAEEYDDFVNGLMSVPSDLVEPLEYRRVLTDPEADHLWGLLISRYKFRGSGYGWYPLAEDIPPISTLAFHFDLWSSRNGSDVLMEFFARENMKVCYFLRELWPPNVEVDVELVAEMVGESDSWLLTDAEWVLYTSHESSFTLTGSLADFFRSKWTDAEELTYEGPYSTTNLRGTWNLPA
jgi:hypothetical protein